MRLRLRRIGTFRRFPPRHDSAPSRPRHLFVLFTGGVPPGHNRPTATGETLHHVHNEPAVRPADPDARRPPIAAFRFALLSDARRRQDTERIAELLQDPRAKTYTEIGGMVLAEGVRETEDGLIAHWISPLKGGPNDRKHQVLTGMIRVRRRGTDGGSYEVESLDPDQAALVCDITGLKAALKSILARPPGSAGRPAAYLRALPPAGCDRAGARLSGGAAAGGGRIDLRDRLIGDNRHLATPEEGLRDFLLTPLGNALATRPWPADARFEILPAAITVFGSDPVDRWGTTPERPYLMPAPAEAPEAGAVEGYADSVVRLCGVCNADRTRFSHFVATLVRPTDGGLYALKDVHTANHRPVVDPVCPDQSRS